VGSLFLPPSSLCSGIYQLLLFDGCPRFPPFPPPAARAERIGYIQCSPYGPADRGTGVPHFFHTLLPIWSFTRARNRGDRLPPPVEPHLLSSQALNVRFFSKTIRATTTRRDRPPLLFLFPRCVMYSVNRKLDFLPPTRLAAFLSTIQTGAFSFLFYRPPSSGFPLSQKNLIRFQAIQLFFSPDAFPCCLAAAIEVIPYGVDRLRSFSN